MDKTTDSLNMLFDYDAHGIDLDILMARISNVQCCMSGYFIESYPHILDGISNVNNIIINSVDKIPETGFPYLLGNIDKKFLWNRIETQAYTNKMSLVLLLGHQNNIFSISDPDIAPNLLVSQDKLKKSLNNKFVIKISDDIRIIYSLKQSYLENIENIFSSNNIGSKCYLEIYNRLFKRVISSTEKMALYYSIREQSICSYKMIDLLKKFNCKKLIILFEYELVFFDKIIISLTGDTDISIVQEYFLMLAKNRHHMEVISREVQ